MGLQLKLRLRPVVTAGQLSACECRGHSHATQVHMPRARCFTVDATKPLLDVVESLEPGPRGGYGLDVHAIVALDRVPHGWGRGEMIKVVYRETERDPRLDVPLAEPHELNRFEHQVGMHGRGVTLLVGHDRHTVAACTLIAQGLLMLIQQIRSLEDRAGALLHEATQLSQKTVVDYSADRIDRIATLAAEVQRLDVLVATEVESVFANGSLPEIILDSYRDSLARTLGVSQAIQATSRTLTKVREFISAEFERMASEHREAITKRESNRALLAAGASAIFLPTALFLAVLAMGTHDINHDVSVFSTYYLPLWISYAVLTLAGVAIVALFGLKRK